jgi:hypothetical protein
MTEFPFRVCKCCHEVLPIHKFGVNRKHGKVYRVHRCNGCRALAQQKAKDASKNAQVSALLRWPAPNLCAVERHGTG